MRWEKKMYDNPLKLTYVLYTCVSMIYNNEKNMRNISSINSEGIKLFKL